MSGLACRSLSLLIPALSGSSRCRIFGARPSFKYSVPVRVFVLVRLRVPAFGLKHTSASVTRNPHVLSPAGSVPHTHTHRDGPRLSPEQWRGHSAEYYTAVRKRTPLLHTVTWPTAESAHCLPPLLCGVGAGRTPATGHRPQATGATAATGPDAERLAPGEVGWGREGTGGHFHVPSGRSRSAAHTGKSLSNCGYRLCVIS